MLPKLASHRDGIWQIRDTPPGVFHVHGKTTLFTHDDDWMGLGDWRKLMEPIYRHYVKSLGPVRGNLLAHFSMQDVAFKVVGVGSVGTRCLILLMVDPHEKPLFHPVQGSVDLCRLEVFRSAHARSIKASAWLMASVSCRARAIPSLAGPRARSDGTSTGVNYAT